MLAGNLGLANSINPNAGEGAALPGGEGAPDRVDIGCIGNWAEHVEKASEGDLNEREIEADDLEDMFDSEGGELCVYEMCLSILDDLCLEIASPETQEDPQTKKKKKRTAGDADFTPPEDKYNNMVQRRGFQFSALNDTDDFIDDDFKKKENIVMKLQMKN